MLAKLVNDEDKIIQILPVASADEIGDLNQRAQDCDSGMEWRPVTAADWFELGKLTAQINGAHGGFKNG